MPELLWAAVFVLLCAGTLLFQFPGWIATLSASLVLTLFLVTREMRRPCYHGVAWQRVNPSLPSWWKSRTSEKVR